MSSGLKKKLDNVIKLGGGRVKMNKKEIRLRKISLTKLLSDYYKL